MERSTRKAEVNVAHSLTLIVVATVAHSDDRAVARRAAILKPPPRERRVSCVHSKRQRESYQVEREH